MDRLTAFTAESFGGPDRFSRELGFGHLISVHRHLKIFEGQRRRFVELYVEALDEAGMPDDGPFREAVRSHVEFGSRVAMQNSHTEGDDEPHPLREVPAGAGRGTSRSPPCGVGIRNSAIVRDHNRATAASWWIHLPALAGGSPPSGWKRGPAVAGDA